MENSSSAAPLYFPFLILVNQQVASDTLQPNKPNSLYCKEIQTRLSVAFRGVYWTYVLDDVVRSYFSSVFVNLSSFNVNLSSFNVNLSSFNVNLYSFNVNLSSLLYYIYLVPFAVKSVIIFQNRIIIQTCNQRENQ